MDLAIHPRHRIGPNAITRVAETLDAQLGRQPACDVFAVAGLTGYLLSPPTEMVDEADVTRLHQALRAELGGGVAAEVARDAGRRTADYLLANRIPRPVQWSLKHLPPALASRILLSAIGKHAWTFAGSGTFTAAPGRPVVLAIRGNPLCAGQRSDEPVCDFYAATFERLFQVLVHPATQVEETACEARGDDACRFELRW
jgi:divinyl protochlorophyllide a 8-vinyl-reductase